MRKKKTKRSAEITVETEELLFRQVLRRPVLGWCSLCRSQVRMAAPEEAAQIAGVTPRMLYRWIEEERIHFSEQAGRDVLVCVPSVSGLKGQADRRAEEL